MSNRITVAHSPDSDDAFMFFGLASGAVETGGLVVDQVLADIETLNRAAFDGKYEVTAVSFHAYAHLADKYALLPHGASMGDNYGPIVVGEGWRSDPGQGPTHRDSRHADDRLSRAAPLRARFRLRRRAVRPDSAGGARRQGRGRPPHPRGSADVPGRGLQKIVDLGEWWSERTGGLPLPLGGNIIRRDLGPEMIAKVSKMLHDSIAHALSHRQEAVEYALQFGRGLDRDKTDRFVGMYVNDLTLSYGDRGRRGLERLMDDAFEQRLIPQRVPVEFAA